MAAVELVGSGRARSRSWCRAPSCRPSRSGSPGSGRCCRRASVARTEKVCAPSARPRVGLRARCRTRSCPASSLHSNVAPGSSDENSNVARARAGRCRRAASRSSCRARSCRPSRSAWPASVGVAGRVGGADREGVRAVARAGCSSAARCRTSKSARRRACTRRSSPARRGELERRARSTLVGPGRAGVDRGLGRGRVDRPGPRGRASGRCCRPRRSRGPRTCASRRRGRCRLCGDVQARRSCRCRACTRRSRSPRRRRTRTTASVELVGRRDGPPSRSSCRARSCRPSRSASRASGRCCRRRRWPHREGVGAVGEAGVGSAARCSDSKSPRVELALERRARLRSRRTRTSASVELVGAGRAASRSWCRARWCRRSRSAWPASGRCCRRRRSPGPRRCARRRRGRCSSAARCSDSEVAGVELALERRARLVEENVERGAGRAGRCRTGRSRSSCRARSCRPSRSAWPASGRCCRPRRSPAPRTCARRRRGRCRPAATCSGSKSPGVELALERRARLVEENSNVAAVELVGPAGRESIVVSGAVVSTVQVRVAGSGRCCRRRRSPGPRRCARRRRGRCRSAGEVQGSKLAACRACTRTSRPPRRGELERRVGSSSSVPEGPSSRSWCRARSCRRSRSARRASGRRCRRRRSRGPRTCARRRRGRCSLGATSTRSKPPASSLHSNVAPASLDENSNEAEPDATVPDGPSVIEVSGGVVSGSGSEPGGFAGTSGADPSSRTHFATDGTPSFSAKSMYQPGGATFAEGGLLSVYPLPACSVTIASGTSRWLMSFACVTADGAIEDGAVDLTRGADPERDVPAHGAGRGRDHGRGPLKRYGGE